MEYIALLRGINVGGHRVPMARLRDVVAELEFENMRSYIQTGNVFFKIEQENRDVLRRRIEEH